MKVVHLCLASFFPDGYSYQENMLPKYHKAMGCDVEVIASLQTFDSNGKNAYLPKAQQYENEYAIPVTRLAYKRDGALCRKLKRYIGTAYALEKSHPDILFIHGCQFLDIDVVAAYLRKHVNVRAYVDNHADFSNSATNWVSKYILHRMIWRRCAHLIEPYVTSFYGVLPVRVNFLKDEYKLPAEKCKLLVMGADDELVQAAKKPGVRSRIRAKYHIAQNDFLIMTGGKIDEWKTQTLLLMKAVKQIENPNVKLIVFGSVIQDLKENVESLCNTSKVQYIGWVKSEDSYPLFAAADLVVFPGRHSVFWEQVTGQGIPMIVKDWPGTHHVDLGGNVEFLHTDSVEEIKDKIENVLIDENRYFKMKLVAQNEGMKLFSYMEIAKRSIET